MKNTILASIVMGSLISIALAAPVGAAEPLRLTEPQMDMATGAGFSLQLSAVAVGSGFGHATATATATTSTQGAPRVAASGWVSGGDGLKGVVDIQIRSDGAPFSRAFAIPSDFPFNIVFTR